MSIKDDIQTLLSDGIIDQNTAHRLARYYSIKNQKSSKRIPILIAVLGGLFIGLGIILILAHNWDQISKTTKTVLAILPLILGYLLCGFALIRRSDDEAWRESTSMFLVLAFGACLALIGQIYHLPSNMGLFYLTWSIATLPLIYIMRSAAASVLYISGITLYVIYAGYSSGEDNLPASYWALLAAVIPYYHHKLKTSVSSYWTIMLHWWIALSMTVALGSCARSDGDWLYPGYLALFGIFSIMGDLMYTQNRRVLENAYRTIGAIGSVIVLLMLGYDWFWNDWTHSRFDHLLSLDWSVELWTTIIVSLIYFSILVYARSTRPTDRAYSGWVYASCLGVFLLGIWTPWAQLAINLILILYGLKTIFRGLHADDFGVFNFGLIIIISTVLCRFFDGNLPFAYRGLLFLILGVCFVVANYFMIKRRNSYAAE